MSGLRYSSVFTRCVAPALYYSTDTVVRLGFNALTAYYWWDVQKEKLVKRLKLLSLFTVIIFEIL